MECMGYIYRKGTHATRSIPSNFDELQQDFYKAITKTVKKFKIPDQLIINFYQTSVNIVLVSVGPLRRRVLTKSTSAALMTSVLSQLYQHLVTSFQPS